MKTKGARGCFRRGGFMTDGKVTPHPARDGRRKRLSRSTFSPAEKVRETSNFVAG